MSKDPFFMTGIEDQIASKLRESGVVVFMTYCTGSYSLSYNTIQSSTASYSVSNGYWGGDMITLEAGYRTVDVQVSPRIRIAIVKYTETTIKYTLLDGTDLNLNYFGLGGTYTNMNLNNRSFNNIIYHIDGLYSI